MEWMEAEMQNGSLVGSMLYSLSPSTTVCQLYFPLGVPPIRPLGLLPEPPPPPLRSQPGYAVLTLVLPPDLSSLTI